MKEEELKETKTKDRRYKTYQNLLMYLKRKKLDNCGSLATFLLETFINSPLEKRDGEFVLIFKHDLELAGLIKENERYEDWRDLMIKRGILNWKVKPNDFNFVSNKNYFAPSDSLLSYINKEKLSQSTVATMDDVGKIEKNLSEKVEKLELALKETNKKIEKVAEYILHQNPPDTPERKQIVVENIDDLPKALELLAQQRKQVDRNIKETGKMFN